MSLALDKYRRKYMPVVWNTGMSLYRENQVHVKESMIGYIDELETPVCRMIAEVNDGNKQYKTMIMASSEEILFVSCTCPEHRAYRNSYYSGANANCRHIAAITAAMCDYQTRHDLAKKTTKSIAGMIARYTNEQITAGVVERTNDRLKIEPKLERQAGVYKLSFRVGTSSMYVIKDLYEFTNHMMSGDRVSYGKNLEFVHHLNSFSEEGQQLVQYIMNRTNENILMLQQLGQGYYTKLPEKRYIIVTPAAMDAIFPLLDGKSIQFDNKDERDYYNRSKSEQLLCVKGNPKLDVHIKPKQIIDNRVNPVTFGRPEIVSVTPVGKRDAKIEGIAVSCELTSFRGEQHYYIIREGCLYQTDENFKRDMQPFIDGIRSAEMVIGRDKLGNFYHHVLPKIREFSEVKEEEPEKIEAVLPPLPEFTFYLDYPDKRNVTCKAEVSYDGRIYDMLLQDEDYEIRDYAMENEVILCIRYFLPEIDKAHHFHCKGDEDKVYQFLDSGFSELMKYGEVKITDAFGRLQIRSTQVSVGVSLKSNLLDLNLSSEYADDNELLEILASYRLKKKYHRLKNGDFLKMDDNSLTALAELVDGLQLSEKDLVKGHFQIPSYRALYLDKVLKENTEVKYVKDGTFKAVLRDFNEIAENEFEVPAELFEVLRPYQTVGFRWLKTIEAYGFGGILADDMGLGKTLEIISVLLAAKQKNGRLSSLIVCPASLVYNWESECSRFAPELHVMAVTGTAEERAEKIKSARETDVLVTSYDLLKRDIDEYKDLNFDYQVIDEAQYIKNHSTQGAKCVKIIKAVIKYALTGTPIENRLSELWSIFDYLMPGFLYRYERFKKEIEVPIVKNNSEQAMERLKKMVSPFILRRLKKDVLRELPDKLEETTYSKFECEQQKIYDAYVQKVKTALAIKSKAEFEKSKIQVLAELTRLRQICCDPSLCYEDYKGESAKLNTCIELLEGAIGGGHKVLLFSQFTSMLSIIERELNLRGISYFIITGATPKEKRLEEVNAFNSSDVPVFLISLKAGGTGLNLASADIVIHYDPWWNIAAQNQATDRAHRIGQTNVVTVFKLIAKGTIEEKIQNLQQSKSDLANQVLSGEVNSLGSMTKEDLMELF